jgi:RHS repeat-associated protein
MSGASAPYSLGSLNTAALLADATGQMASVAASTTSLALAATSTPALLSSSASPSVLFQSTHTGGPSFESYRGSSTGPTFDAAGRLTRLVDANAGVTQFTYDTSGNLASLADPVGNTTSWAYDDEDRLTEETDALGNTRTYTYDDLGNLSRYTDRNAKIRQFSYDAAGNLASETWYANGTDADAQQNATNTITYERDSAGRIVSEWDEFSSVIYVYSAAGQITSTTQSSVGGPTVTLDYQYDNAGRRTRMAATIDGVADFVDDYVYDSQGRVVSVVEHGVEGGNAVTLKEIGITYNDAGRIISIDRYENGQLAVEGDYSYDSYGRLVGLVYHQGGTILNSYAWTYSGDGVASGQWLAADASTWLPTGGLMPVHDTSGITDSLMSGGFAGVSLLTSCTSIDGVASYRYDPTGQLVGADYTGGQANESYAWDANGNRVDAGYVIGTDNRLLSDGAYWYSYDSEGNRTARWIDANADGLLNAGDTGITQYVWDARNRLVEVVDRTVFGGDPTQIVDYLYDVENRWIGENVDADGDGTVDHQVRFVYDGNQIVLQFEKDGEGAVTGADLSHHYLWQPDAVDKLMADEHFFSLASEEGHGYDVSTPGNIIWALGDHLGTVRDLGVYDSKLDTTTVANHRAYDSYGNLQSQTNAAVDCLFGFTGRLMDSTTGLQNNWHRWYSAKTGSWINEDPIGFNGRDANLCRYVANSPMTIVDPMGLSKGDEGPRNAGDLIGELPATSSPYWFILFTNHDGSHWEGFHTWIAVVDLTVPGSLNAVGFGPTTGVGRSNPTAPGTYKNELKTQFTFAIAYPLTKQQYTKVVTYLTTMSKRSAPGYDLFNYNCTAWAVQVMKVAVGEGDLPTPILKSVRTTTIDPFFKPSDIPPFIQKGTHPPGTQIFPRD